MRSVEEQVVAAHRAFYDAVETADFDLMSSLWADDPGVSCVHPAAHPLYGTEKVLRSWAVLMAQIDYIQFFLTDIEVTTFPSSDDPQTALVVCTENILSEGESIESFTGGSAVCSSVLVRDGGQWRFWSRHASPVAVVEPGDEADA